MYMQLRSQSQNPVHQNNHQMLVGLRHSQSPPTNHTSMLTHMIFWTELKILFFLSKGHSVKKPLAPQTCNLHFQLDNSLLYVLLISIIKLTSCCRYGPFWICTTLIFVSASIGTSVTYLADRLNHKNWDYDIHLLTWSATVLYGYAVFVPIILYIVMKYLSVPLGLVQLLCLYGYSLFIFIPAVVRF